MAKGSKPPRGARSLQSIGCRTFWLKQYITSKINEIILNEKMGGGNILDMYNIFPYQTYITEREKCNIIK